MTPLQTVFDYADSQVARVRAAGRKGWLAAFRDTTLFKVASGYGHRYAPSVPDCAPTHERRRRRADLVPMVWPLPAPACKTTTCPRSRPARRREKVLDDGTGAINPALQPLARGELTAQPSGPPCMHLFFDNSTVDKAREARKPSGLTHLRAGRQRCDHLHRNGGVTTSISHTTRALYRVPEAMALLSMSRSAIYEQIRSNRLRSVKQGRSRLIPQAAIVEYIARLERESGRAA